MTDLVFVDTNILVYARDSGAGEKQVVAVELMARLWASRTGRVSVQVLSEYFVSVTQKLKPGMKPEQAWSDCQAMQSWGPLPIDWKLMESGRKIQERYRLFWWDSLIVAAAHALDCRILYSEDLAHHAQYGAVSVVNPFAGEA